MRGAERSRLRLGEVSSVLWRERRLLALLVDTLERERLLAATGSLCLLHAERALEAIRAELRSSELDRAMAVVAAAPDLGLDPDATLSALAAAADDPWSELLDQHRTALRRAISAATHQSRLTRMLLVAPRTWVATASLPERPSRPWALEAALAATRPVRPPSLLDFLR
ncbi:MAG: flagellar protein FlgN [Actinomycetota bacterium]|nr:flagellar protein FlgN [Actinomycetota bacterium]